MTQRRIATAGVSLIEMLVVLALFAIVAGGVIVSLPGSQGTTSADASARAFSAQLDRAVDLALMTGAGFGVVHDGATLRFVQRDPDGTWRTHDDKQLAQAKLSVESARISIDAEEVFAVSARLIPSQSVPLRAEFGQGARTKTVSFDGARVSIQEEQE